MKILAVGGGSGGHVTPVVAVLRELRSRDSNTEIRFWCDHHFASQAQSIMSHLDETIPVETIISGKLRRYHNLSIVRQLLRPISIVLPNIRDVFLVGMGIIQSLVKLIFWRPDVVFTKGGYVCLPVGVAAWLLRIPLVIHDSDAHPGLTNRILARWAKRIATGAPLEYYPYPKQISRHVGIPISAEFIPFSSDERYVAKQQLGVAPDKPLIVITGGGLGARRINDAVTTTLEELLSLGTIVLISGTLQYDELKAVTPQTDTRFQLHAFISQNMARMMGAADIVVARAGATTILELAALAKPTVLIPNGYLTGGHQLKNAAVYAEKDAVVVIDEHDLDHDHLVLARSLERLLAEPHRMEELGAHLGAFARPQAASEMADMIIEAVKPT